MIKFIRLCAVTLTVALIAAPVSAQIPGPGATTALTPLASVAKSADYTTQSSDLGKSIDVTTGSSADVTITLLSASTAGNGALQVVTKVDSGSKKAIVSNGANLAWLSLQGDTVTMRSDGSAWTAFTWSIAPRKDSYATAGSATWTKPPLARLVDVVVIGSGSGAGSGSRCSTNGSGGASGSSGAITYAYNTFASFWGSTEAVVVGAKGTGGAAQTSNDTNGIDGTPGAISSFSSSTKQMLANTVNVLTGGGGGKCSANSVAAVAGVGRTNGVSGITGASAGSGSNGGQTSGAWLNGVGGSGSGQTATPSTLNGGLPALYAASGVTQGTAGIGSTKTNPVAGVGPTWDFGITLAGSGGGGFANADGTAGPGASATGCGGSGGGGGASANGNASGAGGDGTDGCVNVITRFN